MLIFTDEFDWLSEDEMKKRWDKPSSFISTRELSGLVVCKPEHQQYFDLIGCEFVDDLTDTEN